MCVNLNPCNPCRSDRAWTGYHSHLVNAGWVLGLRSEVGTVELPCYAKLNTFLCLHNSRHGSINHNCIKAELLIITRLSSNGYCTWPVQLDGKCVATSGMCLFSDHRWARQPIEDRGFGSSSGHLIPVVVEKVRVRFTRRTSAPLCDRSDAFWRIFLRGRALRRRYIRSVELSVSVRSLLSVGK